MDRFLNPLRRLQSICLGVSSESVEELASLIGCKEDVLLETIDAWKEAIVTQVDTEFERTSFGESFDGPYYAIQVTPAVHHTMGGLLINEKAQVIAEDGKTIIPGLYACGEVTGGIHGANRLGGNAICDIVVFGRIAGMQASLFEGME